MKIRKYIEAKELIPFDEVLQYCYDCDYCIVNHDEEGNKTSIEILPRHLDQAIEVQETLADDADSLKFLELIKSLLKILEENEIDFVRI
jgi:hypothetical protein